jgi:hypothetical protein
MTAEMWFDFIGTHAGASTSPKRVVPARNEAEGEPGSQAHGMLHGYKRRLFEKETYSSFSKPLCHMPSLIIKIYI